MAYSNPSMHSDAVLEDISSGFEFHRTSNPLGIHRKNRSHTPLPKSDREKLVEEFAGKRIDG